MVHGLVTSVKGGRLERVNPGIRLSYTLEMAAHSQKKFIFLLGAVQTAFVVIFCLMVRYDDISDGIGGRDAKDPERESRDWDVIQKQYPLAQDIQTMLFLGFGFLMCFLKNYGYTALVMTMTIIVVGVEWGIICIGLIEMGDDKTIWINWTDVVDASFGAATVLVSFGVLIGKVSPLQILVMTLVEIPIYAGNSYLGYTVLQAVDAGGTIFIHTFGAYFGFFASLVFRGKNYDHPLSSDYQNSRYTSDHFSFLGTLILWVYWPSFNAYGVFEDSRHRAIMNTYISMSASTVTTLICSGAFGDGNRFNAVDLQNASLSGGVIVGSVANLLLQPYGAIVAGSVAGIISTFGYQYLQNWLLNLLNLHDSCGVNNLHGMPGMIGGFLSVFMAYNANKISYGNRIHTFFPATAPEANTTDYLNLLESMPDLEPGLGRTQSEQALYQLAVLGITLGLALVAGMATGMVLTLAAFDPPKDEDMFQDIYFNLPNSTNDEEGSSRAGDEDPPAAGDKAFGNMLEESSLSVSDKFRSNSWSLEHNTSVGTANDAGDKTKNGNVKRSSFIYHGEAPFFNASDERVVVTPTAEFGYIASNNRKISTVEEINDD